MPADALTAATRALPDSQAFLELALDASHAGTWSWDVATNTSSWDARYHELYGFPADERPTYEGWLARVHPDDRDALGARVAALLEPGADSTWNEEFRVLHPVHGVRWMAGVGSVERDADGRALRFRGINLDVTERKRIEELWRRRLERSEEIAHVGHWTWRLADGEVAWSPEVYRIFGLATDTPPAMDVLARAVHPEDRGRLATFGRMLMNGSLPDDVVECRVVAADGVTRHILGTISGYLRDRDGTVTQISGVMHDITARKRAEAEVARIGEEERRRVAADLHDGVLQELAGIAYLTASVRAELEGGNDALADRLRRIERAIVHAIDHTRQVACAADPMLPGGDGLLGALRQFAGSVEATYGTRCTLEYDAPAAHVDDPVATSQLYRIAQEAVRNAVRHGQAAHVRIRLSGEGARLLLRITDDGRGIASDAGCSGMGLHVMRYRAGLIGGRLTIAPLREGGTEVSCRFTPARRPS